MCRCPAEHSAAGLRGLIAVLARNGAREAAIGRPDGPVVDALLGAGVTVVVISPNRSRTCAAGTESAGNKDDRFDAYVLADTLRTDRARLAPLTPGSPATVSLRRTCPGPQGPRLPPRRRGQPAPRAPAQRLPRRGRAVRRDRLAGQPALPGPLPHPGPRRLALAPAPGSLAGQLRLRRPAPRPPPSCTPA